VILVVQLDHLGDAILSTGMLAALRRRYPAASIEVLVGEWNRELFEAMSEVDRVHVSRVNRFSRGGRLGWAVATLLDGWRLRRRNVDLGIDVRGEFPVALILWLSGARRRLGWAAGGGGFLLTDTARFVHDRPEIASRRALMDLLDIPPAEGGEGRPVFRPTRDARASVARRLAAFSPVGPLVVMHVSAGTSAKQWPPEHWRELIGRLIVAHGASIVLVGGPADRGRVRAILEDRTWPGVVDLTGRLGVVELAALLEHATVLVGADSGPAHLAAAVGTPVVALFSGTNNPAQWRPQGERVTVLRHPVGCRPCHRQRCPRPEHPCMSGLRPETVAAAVEEHLDPRPASRTREEIHKGVVR
jgi:lipopolysaccharide heptosyltransferase II